MTLRRALLVLLPLLAASAAHADQDTVTREQLPDGVHWRMETEHGVVHAWAPLTYRARRAGVVVYVHGYGTDVDHAWDEQKLAAQFAASGRNALFIVPEAPASGAEEPSWPELGDLLRTVFRDTAVRRPAGALVVVGHSGAFRTVVPWLAYTPLDDVILLDGLYGCEEDFRQWLDEARGHAHHRLTLVSLDTRQWAGPFVAHEQGAETADRVPERIEELSPQQRGARLLNLRSQYDHMDLVLAGKTIPVLLLRAPLGEAK